MPWPPQYMLPRYVSSAIRTMASLGFASLRGTKPRAGRDRFQPLRASLGFAALRGTKPSRRRHSPQPWFGRSLRGAFVAPAFAGCGRGLGGGRTGDGGFALGLDRHGGEREADPERQAE